MIYKIIYNLITKLFEFLNKRPNIMLIKIIFLEK